MELGKVINDSAVLINKAAKQLGKGDSNEAMSSMLDLRALVDDPIEIDGSDGGKMPNPKCESCGQDL